MGRAKEASRLIRTESLTKFYGRRCAVRDLDVEIADNEIVGFLGRNGAGKTTTLRMLAGLLAPSSGRIHIDGREMDADNAAEVRWRIGFLPQQPPLYEDMTVRGFFDFAARLRGIEDGVEARIDEVTEMVDVVDYRDERIGNLSDGYKQRVGIGQAVIHDPALVILDEPTSQLDPAQLREMRTIIRQLKDRHTVLLSSHNLPEISQTCDRLMVIHDGQLQATGDEESLRGKLGAGNKVELAVIGSAEKLDETLTVLQKDGLVAGVSVQAHGDQLFVDATLTRDEPQRLARAVIEAGLDLTRLQPQQNELEAVFLQLTGEQP
ncbi:MAG: ABC transporter ATP-binding protein [Myxococcota bacterium]